MIWRSDRRIWRELKITWRRFSSYYQISGTLLFLSSWEQLKATHWEAVVEHLSLTLWTCVVIWIHWEISSNKVALSRAFNWKRQTFVQKKCVTSLFQGFQICLLIQCRNHLRDPYHHLMHLRKWISFKTLIWTNGPIRNRRLMSSSKIKRTCLKWLNQIFNSTGGWPTIM